MNTPILKKNMYIHIWIRIYIYKYDRAITGTFTTCGDIITTKSGCKSFRGYDATGSVCIIINHIYPSRGTCTFWVPSPTMASFPLLSTSSLSRTLYLSGDRTCLFPLLAHPSTSSCMAPTIMPFSPLLPSLLTALLSLRLLPFPPLPTISC